MLIKDAFTVDAPIDAVWDFLQDIPRVASCVPGVEDIVEVEPDVYRGRLKARVGPLAVSFGGQVALVERVPRERLTAVLEGDDKSSASFVKASFTGHLTQTDGGTQLAYEVDMALRGRLAQFGFAVFQGMAKKMTAEFARRLQEALAGDMGVTA